MSQAATKKKKRLGREELTLNLNDPSRLDYFDHISCLHR